jgi:cation:H+ antiporter
MLEYLLLLIGFVALIKGADLLVSGASSVAKKFGISSLVIGLTIVAFGTSAPELIVNIISSVKGNPGIAIGNVLGSNIANILLILGIAALIYPLKITKGTAWKEIPLSLMAVLSVFLMANDRLIDNNNFLTISRIDGILLLFFFIIFLYYTYGISKVTGQEDNSVKQFGTFKSVLYIVLGLVGLTLGGRWVVESAITIASNLGLSESFIGLTVVAIGTSLPELATSAIAAYKKQADIAVGNIVGSNIFNIFFILGTSAAILPLQFNSIMNFDVIVCVLTTIILFALIFIGKKHILERYQGGLMVCFYILYIGYLIARG